MNRFHEPLAGVAFNALAAASLLTAEEIARIRELLRDKGLAETLAGAETVHLHIKVDDTKTLPRTQLEAAGARWDHGREGFVKFRFPDGVNAIFSHVSISEDDLRETACSRRPRPFLDHLGIDVREITARSRAEFERIPALAAERGWASVNQGDAGKGVRCCHVEVEAKHWIFPSPAGPGLPVEIALGPLVEHDVAAGCDLRPADPRLGGATQAASCGAATA